MSANLHHLQLFYYVAKAEGISASLRTIPYPVQQPAVSQQLKQLEKELGVVLFERRPFSLTPAGEKLFKFVSTFFDNLENELALVKNESGMRVSFGCPMVISSNYLPELISSMRDLFPNLLPCVKELEGIDIFGALFRRDIDIALTLAEVPSNKQLDSLQIASIPMSIIVPEGHSFASKGFWAKSDLKKQQWICLQGNTGGSSELTEGMAILGATPDFTISTNSVEAALNYVENGLGLCMMAAPPKSLIENRKLAVVDASENFGTVELSVVWSHDCSVSQKLLKSFIASCEALAKKYI